MPFKDCVNTVADLDEFDAENVVNKFDVYRASNVGEKKAAQNAIADTIAELEAEKQQRLDAIHEQHPDLTPEAVAAAGVPTIEQDIARLREIQADLDKPGTFGTVEPNVPGAITVMADRAEKKLTNDVAIRKLRDNVDSLAADGFGQYVDELKAIADRLQAFDQETRAAKKAEKETKIDAAEESDFRFFKAIVGQQLPFKMMTSRGEKTIVEVTPEGLNTQEGETLSMGYVFPEFNEAKVKRFYDQLFGETRMTEQEKNQVQQIIMRQRIPKTWKTPTDSERMYFSELKKIKNLNDSGQVKVAQIRELAEGLGHPDIQGVKRAELVSWLEEYEADHWTDYLPEVPEGVWLSGVEQVGYIPKKGAMEVVKYRVYPLSTLGPKKDEHTIWAMNQIAKAFGGSVYKTNPLDGGKGWFFDFDQKAKDFYNHVVERLNWYDQTTPPGLREEGAEYMVNDLPEEYGAGPATRKNGNLETVDPLIREAVEMALSKMPLDEATRVRDELQANVSTPWASATIRSLAIREMFDMALAGKDITAIAESDVWGKDKLSRYKMVKAFQHGIDAVEMFARSFNFMGLNRKAEHDVASSFANCAPSPDCAKFCYSLAANTRPVELLKAEFSEYMAKHNPQLVADQIYNDYRYTAAAASGLALRINDKGDLSEAQVTVINLLNQKEVNGAPMRLQIFSKRPELLRKLNDYNLRMLSIDSSNFELAIENPDLQLAVTLTEDFTEDQIKQINDRVAVYLPVNLRGGTISKAAVKAKYPGAFKGMQEKLCPIDVGTLKAEPGTSFVHIVDATTKGVWTCTACDALGTHGCFFGDNQTENAKKALRSQNVALNRDPQSLLRQDDDVVVNQKNAIDYLLKTGAIDAQQHSNLLEQLSQGLAGERSQSDSPAAGAAGPRPGTEGEGEAARGRKARPIARRKVTYALPKTKRKGDIEGVEQGRDISAPGPVSDQLDLFTAQGRKQPTPESLVKIGEVRVGSVNVGLVTVNSASEAAHVMAPLRKYGVEQFMTLILDKNKKPISVARMSIGTGDGASVYPRDVAGVLHNTPGARYYWMAHNHPSGVLSPSGADHRITQQITKLTDRTGIEFEGHLIVGPNQTNVAWINDTGTLIGMPDIKALARRGEIPVTEGRFLKRRPNETQLTSPNDSKVFILKNYMDDNGYMIEGVVWLDNRNRVVGFTPFSADKMRKLRTGEAGTGASLLMGEARRHGAMGMFVLGNRPDGLLYDDAPREFAKGIDNVVALSNAADIRALDVFIRDPDGTIRSLAEVGGVTGTDIFLNKTKKGEKPAVGMDKADVEGYLADFLKQFDNQLDLEFRVYPDLISAFGSETAAEIEAEGDLTKGAYYGRDGLIVLIADQLESKADVISTLRHELLAHHGLNLFAPADRTAILKAVAQSRNEPSLRKIWDEIDRVYEDRDTLQRAEEVIARIAESKPGRLSQAWNRIVNIILDALRRIGLVSKAVRKSEIVEMIETINEGLRRGARQRTYPETNDYVLGKTGQEPIYYSQMLDVLAEKLPNKGKPEDMKRAVLQMASKGRFKKEELEWMGLIEWMDDAADRARAAATEKANRADVGVSFGAIKAGDAAAVKVVITKDEVLEFVRNNVVQIKEKVLSTDKFEDLFAESQDEQSLRSQLEDQKTFFVSEGFGLEIDNNGIPIKIWVDSTYSVEETDDGQFQIWYGNTPVGIAFNRLEDAEHSVEFMEVNDRIPEDAKFEIQKVARFILEDTEYRKEWNEKSQSDTADDLVELARLAGEMSGDPLVRFNQIKTELAQRDIDIEMSDDGLPMSVYMPYPETRPTAETEWSGYNEWVIGSEDGTGTHDTVSLDDIEAWLDEESDTNGDASTPRGDFIDVSLGGGTQQMLRQLAQLATKMEQILEDNDAIYPEYTLPGGKRYKEILLILNKDVIRPAGQIREVTLEEATDLIDQVPLHFWQESNTLGQPITDLRDFEADSTWMQAVERGEAVIRTGGIRIDGRPDGDYVNRSLYRDTEDDYRGPHWNDPNILAHIRLNERIDADGKSVLFIEELQSDWHQSGRARGYKTDEVARAYNKVKNEVAKMLGKVNDTLGNYHNLGFDSVAAARMHVVENEAWHMMTAKTIEQADMDFINSYREKALEASKLQSKLTQGMPDAPFKKTWPLLAMKRVIRLAVDKGFDKIAWTTGRQQADRYDIALFTDKIHWSWTKRRGWTIRAEPLSGESGRRNNVFKTDLDEAELQELVGKEMAEKIIEDTNVKRMSGNDLEERVFFASHNNSWYLETPAGYMLVLPKATNREEAIRAALEEKEIENADEFASGEIEGEDLQVGGRGMQGFYDQNLVSMVNKYVKKWGARVGETEIGGTRSAEDAIISHDQMHDTWTVEDRYGNALRVFATEAGAQAFAEEIDPVQFEETTVHAVEITDKMRESAAVAQPMFSRKRRPGSADVDNKQRKAFNALDAGQGIDKVFRTLFEVARVPRVTKRIYDRAEHYLTEAQLPQSRDDGVMNWMNSFIETARAGLIDRYGLPDDFVQREFEAAADKRKIELKALDILKLLDKRGVTDINEAQALQAILTGEAIPTDAWNDISAPIRAAIDEMGQEALDLGLISAESYERNKGTYLHRVYRKHEVERTGLSKWVSKHAAVRRKRLRGEELKGRGMDATVDFERLIKDSPSDWWGRKMAKGQADKQLINKEFHIFDLEQAVGQGTEDLIEGGKQRKPRIVHRVYWPADIPVPAKYGAYENKGKWVVRDMKGDKITLWRDFTKKERENMGEILDARYTIAKTYLLLAHDLSTGRFLKDISQNEAWATREEPDDWVEPKHSYSTYSTAEWVKVPDSTIPGAKAKRWGALSGMYVRAEIWRDLNELDRMQTPSFWQSILTQWKLNKTARNPVVHMNNIMSNMIFMDMADIRWRDLKRGVYAWINKDENYRDALENGAFGASYVEHEIRRDILDPILQELLQEDKALRQGPVEGWLNSSEWGAKMAVLGKIIDQASKQAMKIDKKMVDAYQLEDEIFRMATYMHRREKGDSAADAARIARDQFLNYDIRAPWVNAARRSFLPFIAYTYRAVPVIAKSLSERPWKIAKYATLAYVMNMIGYMVSDGDEDEERRSLRDEVQGRTWIGAPRLIRMPWDDENGSPVFLDIRRWIPAGDVFDFNQNQMPLPAWIQFGGPLMLAAEFALNKQAFTGKEIVNDKTDTPLDKASKYAGWAWRSWMPAHPLIPGSWYWQKISTAATGGRDVLGRDYDLPMAALSSLGIKLAPHDVELGFTYHARAFTAIRKELNWQAQQLAQDKERGLISADEFEKQIQRIKKKQERLAERAAKTFGKQ